MIITITLLAFLVLLLVSLASLTRVETQVAANSQSLSQARQNALLGLNIALGQLQKYTGPDQRVTARAEILDTDPLNRDSAGQPVTDDVPNPYWTGVWDSSKWHELTGVYDGLTGLRGRQRPPAIAWLVSGNEADGITVQPTAAVAGSQMLYSGVKADGSVDAANPRVVVPVVTINGAAPGVAGSVHVGHYAYWVGDDGVKARITTVAPEAVAGNATAGGAGSPASAEYYWKAMQPSRPGVEQVLTDDGASATLTPAFPNFAGVFATDTAGAASRAQLRRIVGDPQAVWLTAGGASVFTQAQMNLHAFDLTTAGAGVLADTERGGLRLDLTRYLETGGTDGAFNATDCIYQDAVDAGIVKTGGSGGGRFPSFALLKSWYDIGRNLGGMAPAASLQSERTSGNVVTQMALSPVITRFHLVYSLMSSGGEADGSGSTAMIVMHPSVTLWNPHNVTLNAEDLVLEMGQQNNRLTIKVRLHNAQTSYVSGSEYSALSTQLNGSLRLLLKGVTLQPGETVIYSLDDPPAGSTTWPAATSGGLPSSFPVMVPKYNNKNYVSVSSGVTLNTAPVPPGDSLEFNLYTAPVATASFTAKLFRESEYASGQTLQDIEDPTWQSSAMTNSSGANVFYAYGSAIPDTSVFIGDCATMRMPWNDTAHTNATTKFMPCVPYANFNLRGTFGRLTSFEGPRGDLEADPLFSWTRLATVPALSSEPGDSMDLAFAGATTVIGGPYLNAGKLGNYAIMFDYPNTDWATASGAPALVSLGSFENADLSSFNLQPTYVFGNSLPDPRIDRENIAGRVSVNPATNPDQIANGINDVYLRDASYLANHALWDRFFLSTIPQTSVSSGDTFDTSVVLANTRLKPVAGMQPGSSGYPKYSDVRSVTKAAGSLLLDGAFNINSTSVEAWRAFLGGLADVVVPNQGWSQSGFPAGSVADPLSVGLRHDYSRFLSPRSHAFNSTAFNSGTTAGGLDGAAWTGHRYLTDAQIAILARNMVEEVKVRGPFMSLADFVNRRLITAAADNSNSVTSDITEHRKKVGVSGALHRALLNLTDLSQGVNAAVNQPVMGSADFSYTGGSASAYAIGGTGTWRGISSWPSQMENMNGGLVGQLNFGAPGFVTQADVLQKIGSALSARSDTFTIRTYGDVQNPATGDVTGRAWCEAVVQRLPEYVDASQPPEAGDSAAGAASLNSTNSTFGRRYVVVSFRWLSASDL